MELPEKLPTVEIGDDSAEPRCRAHKSNGEPCLKPQNPDDPNRCLGGHPWKGNTLRGKSSHRYLAEQGERQLIPTRDRHVRDLGWTPETAPLHVLDYCMALAEIALAMSHARRKRIAEYVNLLLQYDRLISRRENFVRPASQTRGGEFYDYSNEELHTLCLKLAAELRALDEQRIANEAATAAAIKAERAAVPVRPVAPVLPSCIGSNNSDSRPSERHTDEQPAEPRDPREVLEDLRATLRGSY